MKPQRIKKGDRVTVKSELEALDGRTGIVLRSRPSGIRHVQFEDTLKVWFVNQDDLTKIAHKRVAR